MQQTANYNLNLPEGTDVVNPLVDYNPNFTVIDGAMKANADRTVGRATCIKSGTTHVVTRSNTGSNIINFTATGDWNTGDTMTIDSVVVSVFLPDGSAALDGAYLINTEVFGILNGTRFTLYTNAASAIEASKVSYDNTLSGLIATKVQGAIDELAGKTIKTLWTNPNSSVAFPPQAITLNNNDYDIIVSVAIANINAADLIAVSDIALKGYGLTMAYVTGSGAIRSRRLIRVNDTTYTAETGNNGADADNASVVPVVVYGIKL